MASSKALKHTLQARRQWVQFLVLWGHGPPSQSYLKIMSSCDRYKYQPASHVHWVVECGNMSGTVRTGVKLLRT